ncbi:hypothetical protein [Burkholderia metallica]|uniref:hypothetical protein n=1 Tax=Burkholderia metallica TaxID=488729 RepID=UPI00158C0E84|nr:hypothetical protein [Burkholderia metallica]
MAVSPVDEVLKDVKVTNDAHDTHDAHDDAMRREGGRTVAFNARPPRATHRFARPA